MHASPILVALALTATPKVTPDDWRPAIQRGEYAQAKATCERWLASDDPGTRAEAHKCLANVELGLAPERLHVEGDGKGGGWLGPAYDGDAAARAVAHLDAAIGLAPQDLSIHQGRLHVLRLAGRYEDMARALEQSARTYAGADAMDAWLAYPAELFEDGKLEAAATLLLVLDKVHADDHRVAGNLSAAYAMLERDAEALAWATKAVKLAPDDPIDTWNLARIYDYTGKVDLADATYQKSIALQSPEQRKESSCVYAEFVATKKKDVKAACQLQKRGGCPTSACK